jgi:hypothetical protein
MMLTLLKGGPQAAHLGPAPLSATLLTTSDEAARTLALPPQAMPNLAPGASADAAPSSGLAEVSAGSAAPLPSSDALAKEPGAVMSLAPRGSIAYLIIYKQQVLGRSVHRWQHDGSVYTLHSQNEVLDDNGVMQRSSVTSHGFVSAYGVLPVEYSADGRQPMLHFDRERLKARQDAAGDGIRTIALESATQDELSLPYQLGQALLHGRSMELSSASPQGLTRYSFELLGTEDTPLAGARRRVMHLRSRDDGAATLDIWISLDRQHLPLRILRRDESGREIEQVAEKIE